MFASAPDVLAVAAWGLSALLPSNGERCIMQDLSYLPGKHVDTLIHAVTRWCDSRGVTLDSVRGRRAIAIGAVLICRSNIADFERKLTPILNNDWVG